MFSSEKNGACLSSDLSVCELSLTSEVMMRNERRERPSDADAIDDDADKVDDDNVNKDNFDDDNETRESDF